MQAPLAPDRGLRRDSRHPATPFRLRDPILEEESPRASWDPEEPGDAGVLGIGTALPETRVGQQAAAEAVIRFAGLDEGRAAWTRRVFARSGVRERRTVLPELAEGRPPFGGHRRPGTAARMELYHEHAGPLASLAAVRALGEADASPQEVTHLFVVSSTGFHAPGVDVELVACLGLRNEVERTVVGFMGCHGAYVGLRLARRAVMADPRALALVVCVELCTLHVRASRSPEALVAFSLFGDGAAAAVVGAGRSRREVLLELGPAATAVEPSAGPKGGWAIGDDGFDMELSAEVPSGIGRAIPGFVDRLALRDRVAAWCVHPGGPSVLAAARTGLGLPPAALGVSRDVLRDIGNVSSATILFVLGRASTRLAEGSLGVALGFGPGLNIEGFAFRRGGAPSPGRLEAPTPDVAAV